MSSHKQFGQEFKEMDQDGRAQDEQRSVQVDASLHEERGREVTNEGAETNQGSYHDSPERLPESPPEVDDDELSAVSVANESARDRPFIVSVAHGGSDPVEDVSLLGGDETSSGPANRDSGSRTGSYKSHYSIRVTNTQLIICHLQKVPTLPITRTSRKKSRANERKDRKKKQTKGMKRNSYRRNKHNKVESVLVNYN